MVSDINLFLISTSRALTTYDNRQQTCIVVCEDSDAIK